MGDPANTRAQAARILLRVKDHGAYSNVILPAATRDLARPDRAFVYRLVTDALRQIRTADAVVEVAAGRSTGDLDAEVLCVLEIAVAELLAAEPDAVYATVNESVEAVKQLGNPRAAGLVNAVLRSVARDGVPAFPADKARELSVPEWVLGTLTADHGRQTARLLLAGLREGSPPIGIRVRPGCDAPVGAAPVPDVAGAYTLRELPESLDGLVVSDAASTAVVRALRPTNGERILDMAAAPGGKTSALWDDAGKGTTLVAMDAHTRRLRSARLRMAEMGVGAAWVLGSGIAAPFGDESFDAVLVDAPCTGLGTLRRRPEIAMRLAVKRMEALADRQREMLAEAWRITRPGGRIVYSVCTLFAAETVDVVAAYPAAPPPGLPGAVWGAGLLMAPHLTGTDGMFVSLIQRTG